MGKLMYEIIIEGLTQPVRRRVAATNAKKAAQLVASEFGLTLTGKAPSLHTATQWHAVDEAGNAAIVSANR